MTEVTAWPPKVTVVGTPISLTSYGDVLEHIDARPRDRATVVACCNVHSVMTARRNGSLAVALRGAEIATPDGMPLVWALRALGRRTQTRVYGPDLMLHGLRHGAARNWRHFLYGTTNETLERLRDAIEMLAPETQIVGSHAPSFGPLTEDEERAVLDNILESGADIVWVALGMPKQELWMHRVRDRLPGVTLIGVGAAFDFLAGTVPQSPAWLQQFGLEWLYRMAREPRRLWRRYIFNNPAYLVLLAGQLLSTARQRSRVQD